MRGLSGIRDALFEARRPLLLAPALLVGIFLADGLSLRGSRAAGLAAGAGAFALAAAFARTSPGPPLAFSLALAGAGAALAARPDPSGWLPEALRNPQGLLRVEGTVAETPVPARTGESSFDLRVEAIRSEKG